VAVGHRTDGIPLVVKGHEYVVELDASDAEHRIDTVTLQGLDDGLAAGHTSHEDLFVSVYW
jgi:hypothetical protein